jgi:hypothetical protein
MGSATRGDGERDGTVTGSVMGGDGSGCISIGTLKHQFMLSISMS